MPFPRLARLPAPSSSLVTHLGTEREEVAECIDETKAPLTFRSSRSCRKRKKSFPSLSLSFFAELWENDCSRTSDFAQHCFPASRDVALDELSIESLELRDHRTWLPVTDCATVDFNYGDLGREGSSTERLSSERGVTDERKSIRRMHKARPKR